MYNVEELRRIQEKKIEILIDVVKFCNENNLIYWLDSGTLLGAIRHGGFIPWDDDIDIILPKENAEFLKKNYKSEDFEILNTNEEGINFYKVISKKYKVDLGKEIVDLDIDLFLVTEYPDSLAVRFWNSFFHLRKNRIDKFSFILLLKNIFINLKRKLENTKIFCTKNIELKLKKILDKSKGNNRDTPFIAYTPDCGFHLYFWRKNEIFPLKKVKFEGIEFNSPKEHDSYLKKIYYSYMDLPPVEKRTPDHYHGENFKLIEM